jgi:hypothetical protein
MQRQEDWHAYLGLSPQAPEEQIAQVVERLSRQAAALAVTAPERSQRLRDTIRLIKRDLLSGQENRQRYDLGLAAAAGPAAQAAPVPVAPAPAFSGFGGEGVGSRIARFLRTGWTCAACGKEALPSDRFCTKCGTPIKPVQPEAAPARARAACVNCGSALTANDVFCSRCGTRVHTER